MINYAEILSVNYPTAQVNLIGNQYSDIEWLDPSPKPTQEELDALWPSTLEYYAKQSCKQTAQQILYTTDWATIPDIALPENNPRLLNQQEFIAYRNVIRGYAVNPVADPVWPTQPTEQWSS